MSREFQGVRVNELAGQIKRRVACGNELSLFVRINISASRLGPLLVTWIYKRLPRLAPINSAAMNTSNIQEGLQGDIVGSKECMSCRIIGSATFAGVGIYALLQTRRSAPGSFAQKRIIGGLGAGM